MDDRAGCLKIFHVTVLYHRTVNFTRYFLLQNVLFEKNVFIKPKSMCFCDFKHNFKFKIGQVFPEKNGFKYRAVCTILLYSSTGPFG
jgi:hypothetical protein